MTSNEWFLLVKTLNYLSSHAACSDEMHQVIKDYTLSLMMVADE